MKKDLYATMKESVQNEEIEVKTNKTQALAERFKLAEEIFSREVPPKDRAKVVRDNFSFPEEDYQLIESIRRKFISMGKVFNKSEILRLGLIALKDMNENKLNEMSEKIKKIKVGRK